MANTSSLDHVGIFPEKVLNGWQTKLKSVTKKKKKII